MNEKLNDYWADVAPLSGMRSATDWGEGLKSAPTEFVREMEEYVRNAPGVGVVSGDGGEGGGAAVSAGPRRRVASRGTVSAGPIGAPTSVLQGAGIDK